MRIHVLKTWSPYFEETRDGRKPWEMRFNDRDYQVGDFLVLRQFTPKHTAAGVPPGPHPEGKWGKEYVVVRVSVVTRGLIVPPDWVLMTVVDATDEEFVRVMGKVTAENEGGIWSGVGALGVR